MIGRQYIQRRDEPVSARRRWLQGAACAAASLACAPLSLNAVAAEAIPDPDDAGLVAVDGGRVWYRLNGRRHFARGQVPLLVLHGGPGASHHYLLPLVALADQRPVIFYDQLDCGRADRPGDAANWNTRRFVTEIDALRNALGLDRVIVSGSSCGATWAAEYAMDNPPGLLGSIFASPFLGASRWQADAARLRAALPAAVRATLEHHERDGTTDSEAYHAADMVWIRRHVCRLDPFPPYVQSAFELFNNALYKHMWGPSESHLSGQLASYEAEQRLARINTPVLYTCGEFDEATPHSTAAFAQATPGAELAVIAGASHMPHAEATADYLAVVRKFLATA